METPENKILISAVIPAYNEETAVGQTIEELKLALGEKTSAYEIIVVDDGSNDLTAQKAVSAGARVVTHPLNRGYGKALLSGIEQAKYEWILIIDADGSYPVEETEKLLPFIPAFDMVIGARQGPLFWGSWVKAAMRFIYLSMAEFAAGEPIPDANSGLRIFRKKALENSMPIICYGYSFTTTMTLSFLQSGRFVKFVPIGFTERIGKSKIRPVRDILRTLQLMIQVIIHYNPLKLFATLAIANLAAGFVFAAMSALNGSPPGAFVIMMGFIYLSIALFIPGLILDAMRRTGWGKSGPPQS
ncbi:MAG: glycosyltransferase family 2 protein [Elusimicrobia bacterium]|nr:glycosyltransferase family 2 protein [Elusimicrobiota bacterium]